MEIINSIDRDWILLKLLLFTLIYLYYKYIIKGLGTVTLEKFREKYSQRLNNKNLYFVLSVLYGTTVIVSCSLIIVFMVFLTEKKTEYYINHFILASIFAFLYCIKKTILIQADNK